MAEDFQKQILGTLSEMKNSIEILKKDISYLTEYIGDTKLSEEERKLDEIYEALSRLIKALRVGTVLNAFKARQCLIYLV